MQTNGFKKYFQKPVSMQDFSTALKDLIVQKHLPENIYQKNMSADQLKKTCNNQMKLYVFY